MPYHYSRHVGGTFEEVVARTKKALSHYGFGILTEIDVKDVLCKKIGVDMRPYQILGACNPSMAHKALGLEPYVGAMLPCNVVVRQTDDEGTEVSAVDPVESMQAIKNERLKVLAGEVRALLTAAVDEVAGAANR